VLLHSRR